MEKDFSTLFQEIKKELTGYVNTKLKLYKLDLFEKTSVTASALFFGLGILLVVFFTIFFIFLALGFWLGEILNSIAAGMGIVALAYLIALFILLLNRQRIRNKLVNLFLGELINEENDGDEIP